MSIALVEVQVLFTAPKQKAEPLGSTFCFVGGLEPIGEDCQWQSGVYAKANRLGFSLTYLLSCKLIGYFTSVALTLFESIKYRDIRPNINKLTSIAAISPGTVSCRVVESGSE